MIMHIQVHACNKINKTKYFRAHVNYIFLLLFFYYISVNIFIELLKVDHLNKIK